MENRDRAALIELLGRLGAENDETVLQAGRELHRKMLESGATWDDLIRAEPFAVEMQTEAEPAGEPPARKPSGDRPRAPAPERPAPDRAETTRLIERLLARKELSANLRQELNEMKRALAEGSLDVMDSRYVRALAKRLGV
jgi:hypothetical protein